MDSLKKHRGNYSTLTDRLDAESDRDFGSLSLGGNCTVSEHSTHWLESKLSIYTLQLPAGFSARPSTHKLRTQSTVTVFSYQRYKEVPSRERQERRSPPRARQRPGRGRGVRANARPYLRSPIRRLLSQRLTSAGVHGRVHVRSPTLPSLCLAAPHSPEPGVCPPHQKGTENCRRVQTQANKSSQRPPRASAHARLARKTPAPGRERVSAHAHNAHALARLAVT